VLSAGELVDRLDAEYREACASLLRRVA
jgi:hypothetical protein